MPDLTSVPEDWGPALTDVREIVEASTHRHGGRLLEVSEPAEAIRLFSVYFACVRAACDALVWSGFTDSGTAASVARALVDECAAPLVKRGVLTPYSIHQNASAGGGGRVSESIAVPNDE